MSRRSQICRVANEKDNKPRYAWRWPALSGVSNVMSRGTGQTSTSSARETFRPRGRRSVSVARSPVREVVVPRSYSNLERNEWHEVGYVTDPQTGRRHKYVACESGVVYDGDPLKTAPAVDAALRRALYVQPTQ